MADKGSIIVISGPSGVGKGTICNKLKRLYPDLATPTVSVTTRAPRAGEIEGVNYYYRTQQQFDELVQRGEFIETATVYDNKYGTLVSEVKKVLSLGKNVIMEIDTVGAMNIKAKYPNAVLIFVLPPSLYELESRIVGRRSESQESLIKRRGAVKKELLQSLSYDYIIVNRDLGTAVQEVHCIITAEQLRVKNNVEFVDNILGGDK